MNITFTGYLNSKPTEQIRRVEKRLAIPLFEGAPKAGEEKAFAYALSNFVKNGFKSPLELRAKKAELEGMVLSQDAEILELEAKVLELRAGKETSTVKRKKISSEIRYRTANKKSHHALVLYKEILKIAQKRLEKLTGFFILKGLGNKLIAKLTAK